MRRLRTKGSLRLPFSFSQAYTQRTRPIHREKQRLIGVGKARPVGQKREIAQKEGAKRPRLTAARRQLAARSGHSVISRSRVSSTYSKSASERHVVPIDPSQISHKPCRYSRESKLHHPLCEAAHTLTQPERRSSRIGASFETTTWTMAIGNASPIRIVQLSISRASANCLK